MINYICMSTCIIMSLLTLSVSAQEVPLSLPVMKVVLERDAVTNPSLALIKEKNNKQLWSSTINTHLQAEEIIDNEIKKQLNWI